MAKNAKNNRGKRIPTVITKITCYWNLWGKYMGFYTCIHGSDTNHNNEK